MESVKLKCISWICCHIESMYSGSASMSDVIEFVERKE